MTDYFVYMVELPYRVEGITVPNNDGTYSVYINSARSEGTQRAALAHELEHIENDHLYSNKPIKMVEKEADGAIPNLFVGNDPGHVPCFASLEAFKNYIIPFYIQENPALEKVLIL